MNFSVTCKSIKEFDAESGKYVRCGHVVQVNSSQVGTLVQCPECDNDIEVTNPSMLSSVTETIESASFNPQSTDLPSELTDAVSLDSQQSEQTAGSLDIEGAQDDLVEESAVETEPGFVAQTKAHVSDTSALPPSDPLTGFPDQEPPPTETLMPDFAPGSALTDLPVEVDDGQLKKESVNDIQTPTLTPATFSRDNSCHKCGTLLEEKQAECPNCRAPRRAAFVDKKDRKAVSKKGPFGFQFWLSSISIAPPKEGEVNYLAIICYIVSVLLMGSGIAFIVFAGIAGIFVGLFVGFGGYCLFTGTRYSAQTRENPRTPIPLIGKIAWSVILYFLRQGKFGKFPEPAVLDKRDEGSGFGDRELTSMQNLNKFKVIDLEGTDITDAGLLHLYDLRGIQYLIVRNTNVTLDAVHDLHQTIPKTWIWY